MLVLELRLEELYPFFDVQVCAMGFFLCSCLCHCQLDHCLGEVHGFFAEQECFLYSLECVFGQVF